MLIWIALGGAAGSVLRYALGGAVQRAGGMAFPLGTLAVNAAGCFLVGVIVQHYMNMQTSPQLRAALVTGFCGGFTTFSAFSIETVGLLQGGEYAKAVSYILMSFLLAILATTGGILAARTAGI